MAISYIPGELYSLPDHKSTVPAIMLAQSGNTVIFEKLFADGSTSLRIFDWREPIESQKGRAIAYEDLSIWDLRNIVQAGIPWQGLLVLAIQSHHQRSFMNINTGCLYS